MAISGHAKRCARESALPPKADIKFAMSTFRRRTSALPPRPDIHVVIPRRRPPSLVEQLFSLKSPDQLAWLTIGFANPRKISLSKPRSLTRGLLRFIAFSDVRLNKRLKTGTYSGRHSHCRTSRYCVVAELFGNVETDRKLCFLPALTRPDNLQLREPINIRSLERRKCNVCFTHFAW